MSNKDSKSNLPDNTIYNPDCPEAACELFARLDNAEKRAEIEGWISAEELENEFEMYKPV